MTKTPEIIEYISNKILNNKTLYNEITELLKHEILAIHNDSLSHSTFCSNLKTPQNIHKKLLKIFSVSDRQLMAAFQEIGFHPSHKMYSDLYYQTLLMVYYIGVESSDDVLRLYALVLINVKIFNGRKYVYFRTGCQEDIAQYIITNKLRSSTILKKYPSPFIAIMQYYAPNLDEKYLPNIKQDPMNPISGLIRILAQAWNRIDQAFLKTLQKPYYQAWNDSQKKLISLTGDGRGTEVDKIDVSKVETLAEKSLQNLIHKSNKFLPEDIRFFKNPPYKISDKFISDAQHFLNDGENEDDLKNISESILTILKLQDENKICGMHVVYSANKILGGDKKKNTEQSRLKQYIDGLIKLMYPKMHNTISSSNFLRLRKIMLIMIVLRLKRSFCPSAKLEN